MKRSKQVSARVCLVFGLSFMEMVCRLVVLLQSRVFLLFFILSCFVFQTDFLCLAFDVLDLSL